MKKAELTMPEIALIAGTRGILGAGLALLLGDLLNKDQKIAYNIDTWKNLGVPYVIKGQVSGSLLSTDLQVH